MRVFRLKACFVEAGLQTRLAYVVGPAIRRESLPALEEIQVTDVADEVAVGVVMEAVGRPPAAAVSRIVPVVPLDAAVALVMAVSFLAVGMPKSALVAKLK